MSLDFQLNKIANFEELTDEEGPKVITKALIFNCMGIGLGSITEKNVDEVIRRTLMREDVDGPICHFNYVDYYLTADDIRRHIGLSTNVSNVSAGKWEANLGKSAVEKCRYIAKGNRAEAIAKAAKKAG